MNKLATLADEGISAYPVAYPRHTRLPRQHSHRKAPGYGLPGESSGSVTTAVLHSPTCVTGPATFRYWWTRTTSGARS